jgi:hypothetical protein
MLIEKKRRMPNQRFGRLVSLRIELYSWTSDPIPRKNVFPMVQGLASGINEMLLDPRTCSPFIIKRNGQPTSVLRIPGALPQPIDESLYAVCVLPRRGGRKKSSPYKHTHVLPETPVAHFQRAPSKVWTVFPIRKTCPA